MRVRTPRPPATSALTVTGFLLLSAAAFVLGLLGSLILAAGLGLAVAGASALVLGWLVEDEPNGGES